MNHVENTTTPARPSKEVAQPSEQEFLQRVTPPVDVYESEQELLLLVDLPGVRRDTIEVKLKTPRLSIEGRQAPEALSPWGAMGSWFERSFLVPEGFDPDKIEAKLDHGVLHIHLKKSEQLKPKRITVQGE